MSKIKIQRDRLGHFIKGHSETRRENSPHWKGDNVGYYALHAWVKKELGKPTFCSFNKTHKSKRFEWASISHNAKRDLSDYITLCVSCHRKYDDIANRAWVTKRGALYV
jgi:hypothetical protein